ncbi:VirD-like protein [uncultured Candidatus Thioglobus sp.]|nr:VirD-like protein [uncultured Candidatus Thioglobus sp.]
MTAQAVIKRATIPENQRNPFMVYIDEAQEYIDEKIEDMLNQARKQKIGFTLAHQNLKQLGSLKDTVFSSTSIKLAGGISAKDSSDLFLEMRTSKEQLLNIRKVDGQWAEFSCYLKNNFNTSIPFSFDFGLLEKRDVLSANAYEKLIDGIRDRYCQPKESLDFGVSEVVEDKPVKTSVSVKPKVETEKPVEEKKIIKQESKIDAQPEIKNEVVKIKPQGKGGTQHQYLQNLTKKIGQERGYHSIIENPVFGGLGAVDISLDGFDKKIAVEVSVNTQGKWENSNITKCFSASFDYVIILSSERQHLNKIRDDISSEFKDKIKKEKLLFFTADDLIEFLDKIKADSSSTESTVSGYKVKVSYVTSSEIETKIREESLARVVLGG